MESENNSSSSSHLPEDQQSPYVQPFMPHLQGMTMGPGQFAFPIHSQPFGMAPPHLYYPFIISSGPPPSHVGYPVINYLSSPPMNFLEPTETPVQPDVKAIEEYIHSLLKNTEAEEISSGIQQSSIQSEEPSETKEVKSVQVESSLSNLSFQPKRQEKKWIKKGSESNIISNSNTTPLSSSPSSSSSILSSSPPLSSSNMFSTNVSSDLPPAATEKKPPSFQRTDNKYGGSKYSKRASTLVTPKNLEFLSESMVSIYENLRPTPNEFSKRLKILSKLQNIVTSIWADADPNLNLFGSSANEFGFHKSDIDICLSIGPQAGNTQQIVTKLGNVLSKKGMKHITTLPRARVPIVKFEDPQTHFSCDICFNNQLALHNTRLIADYSKIDIRFKYLGYVVKYWAKQRKINEPYLGTLSSYAYLLMVINFLQQRKPPILPSLQQLRDSADENVRVEVEGFDCYYYNKIERLKDFGSANKESPGELLAAFFRLYSLEFDWENAVVSPRTGGYLTKAEKGWTRSFDEKTRDYFFLTIEDPFEITHNLGRLVDRHNLKVIKYEFHRAFRLICNNEDLKNVICKKYREGEK